MHGRSHRWLSCCVVLGLLLSANLLRADDDDDDSSSAIATDTHSELAQYFGFRPVEIFKLSERSANMLACDLNGDGLTDLILCDNSHSRLDILQQRTGNAAPMSQTIGDNQVNVIENDGRFEHRKLIVDHQVASLTTGDFNGDGLKDIAYFGTPEDLIVRFQSKQNDWADEWSIRLPGVQATQWIMAGGDLNSDGRDDLVLLGKSVTYLLYQNEKGTFDSPVTIRNTSDKLALAQISDLDGDGKNDLCYLASEGNDRTLRARLQLKSGQLGPELGFDLQQPRSVTLADLDGQPGMEVMTVDSQTGRLKILKLQKAVDSPVSSTTKLTRYGFGTAGAGRGQQLAIGDLDGNGLQDVIVSDPDSAQVLVYFGQGPTGLDLGQPFPCLFGVSALRTANLDGDGADELLVLSSKEKTLGVSRLQDGRLTFPTAIATENEPLAFELADLDQDGRLEIIYISRKREGSKSSYFLHALKQADGDSWKPQPLKLKPVDGNPITQIELNSSSTPEAIVRCDANRDGRPDFLVFRGVDRTPLLLSSTTGEGLGQVEVSGGIGLGDVSSGHVFIAEKPDPLLAVAQKDFARSLQLDESNQWQVLDQYNANESTARIAGVAALDLDGQPGREIVLVDTGVQRLRLFQQKNSLYQPWKEIKLGEFPFESTHVADLNGDHRDDLLLFGRGLFAVLYTGQADPEFQELASFETPLERGFLADSAAADFNSDGRKDIVVIDSRNHQVELIDYQPQQGLRHAQYFKVFEAKSFSASRTKGIEPREVLAADVTNDGKIDLILLCHDRVLVYPQDDGK